MSASKNQRSPKEESLYYAILKRKAERTKRECIEGGPTMKEINKRFKDFTNMKDTMPQHHILASCPGIPKGSTGVVEGGGV